MYEKVLGATGVYALTVEDVSGKFKFCQNKSKEDRQKIVAKLKNRGLPVDLMFSEDIRKTLK
jgi:predicted FMN-binding regulatory protein PaiB